jgi:hypothetical protein
MLPLMSKSIASLTGPSACARKSRIGRACPASASDEILPLEVPNEASLSIADDGAD